MHPKILHVLSTPRAEGTPRLVLDWMNARPDLWQGILVLSSQPADLADELRRLSAAYVQHDLLKSGLKQFPRIVRASYDMVRSYQPDLLICWVTGMASWVCEGARAAGCKRLIAHNGNPPRRGAREDMISRSVYWPLAALRAKVICCSDYVRDANRAIPGIPPRLFETVYNCTKAGQVAERANRARLPRKSDGTFSAIMVATLEGHKDHATLLRAVPTILAAEPRFRLKIVGDGTYGLQLKKLAAELGLRNVVEFTGSRLDVPELLGQSDLFIFSTTREEGLGSVLLEALAAGLPIVASDVPACRELLQDGKWGHLVPPGDPDALAGGVVGMIRSSHHVQARADAAEYALQFSPERMIGQYLRYA